MTAFIFGAPEARADFIEADLLASGDGLLIEDTTNGLQWFDWSAYPAGMTVDEFFTTSVYAGLGFRQATQSDLELLFTTAGADAISYTSAWVGSPANVAAIELLNATTTHQFPWPDTGGNAWIHAFFDNGGDPTTSGFLRFNSTSWIGTTGIIEFNAANNIPNNRSHSDDWSVMAVRDAPASPVPEPGSLALLGLGLLWVRHRRKSA